MKENIIKLLQNWYKNQFDNTIECNLDLIKIETVDNPGWYVTINLSNTLYEKMVFEKIKFDNSDYDWYFSLIRNKYFEGSGSPQYLITILNIFNEWINKYDEKILNKNLQISDQNKTSDTLYWLQLWYHSQCNEDWEHIYGVEIKSIDYLDWKVIIDLEDSDYMDMTLDKVSIKNNEDDWFMCQIENYKFEGTGSYNHLISILNTFRNTVEKFNQSNSFLENDL